VKRVGLDTNIFMAIFLEEKDKTEPSLQKGRKAVGLIRALPSTTIVDVTADMAIDIANTKVSERLSIADAAVLSSTIVLNSDAFLTYDNDFANVKKIRCMKPEDYLEILEKSGEVRES